MGLFKRKKEADARATAKIDNLVGDRLRPSKTTKRSYQVTCGHCKGSRVIQKGKSCGNCGGSGKITRYA